MNAATAIENDLWLRFLENAIGGLREAARRIGCAELRAHYEARLGWFGKARRDLGGARIPKEEAVSHALVEVLKSIRSEQLVEGRTNSHIDLTKMDFQIEVPRRFEEGIGSRSLPTGIMIAVTHDEIDLRIEAKNLVKDSDITSEYLGRNGLRRFDDVRSPYTIERFGGMVAYVMDEDAVRWRGRVDQAISGARPPLTVLTTIVAGEALTTTSHEREIDSPLHQIKERCRTDVIHLVLEFEANPSLRDRRA
jgi:hypothetical protein